MSWLFTLFAVLGGPFSITFKSHSPFYASSLSPAMPRKKCFVKEPSQYESLAHSPRVHWLKVTPRGSPASVGMNQ